MDKVIVVTTDSMQTDVKRICSYCGIDRTPLKGGIYPINDRRGICLGLFGACCYALVNEAVLQTPRQYRELSHKAIKDMVWDYVKNEKALDIIFNNKEIGLCKLKN